LLPPNIFNPEGAEFRQLAGDPVFYQKFLEDIL
jgi:hypothetical protein